MHTSRVDLQVWVSNSLRDFFLVPLGLCTGVLAGDHPPSLPLQLAKPGGFISE